MLKYFRTFAHKMKRTVLFLLLLAYLTAFAQPKYEVRASWLTVLGNLDWPSGSILDGKGVAAQKQELINILDQLQAINVNTVLLHTRIRATTIYPSDIEPWAPYFSGTAGVSPGYDALQFAIDECHKRGMELHAWVVTIPIGKWKSYGCQQLRQKFPSLVKHIGEEGYMNPEDSRTADYIAGICEEITRRYDIDGIHLDYIRYPETWKGRKNPTYITNIVRAIHDRVKFYKPWVKLSCSPIGKYDNLSRFSSKGWNARRTVAQDAQEWLRLGLMDQLYPMMYFKENNFYPFAIDWQEYSYGRTIVSGLGTYMLHPHERNWPLTEMKRQLNVTRQIGIGHCHFRTKFLLDNVKGIYDYAKYFDRYPALVPPMTWAHHPAPTAPTMLYVQRCSQGDRIVWSGAVDHSDGPYLLYNIYASSDEQLDVNNPANLIDTRCMTNEAFIPANAKKANLRYAVTAVDRYGNERRPIFERDGFISESNTLTSAQSPTTLLANDGIFLNVPNLQQDTKKLQVYNIQGRLVHTSSNMPQLYISPLKDGMYILQSVNKKGIHHRLGHFIIKRQSL